MIGKNRWKRIFVPCNRVRVSRSTDVVREWPRHSTDLGSSHSHHRLSTGKLTSTKYVPDFKDWYERQTVERPKDTPPHPVIDEMVSLQTEPLGDPTVRRALGPAPLGLELRTRPETFCGLLPLYRPLGTVWERSSRHVRTLSLKRENGGSFLKGPVLLSVIGHSGHWFSLV